MLYLFIYTYSERETECVVMAGKRVARDFCWGACNTRHYVIFLWAANWAGLGGSLEHQRLQKNTLLVMRNWLIGSKQFIEFGCT